ncbi:MAG: helix-turn-helix domain-containing protein [Candidatus Jettenia sp.]|nr:helix-turn-helix domain-containing protein [Candidatus Jettenia sp.]
MKMSNAIRDRLEELKKTDQYWADSAKLDFAIAIEEKRRQAGKSYADLARSMQTSNAYITKIFRGDANLTIESMVKLSRVLGYNINFSFKEINEGKKGIKHIVNKLPQDIDMQRFRTNNTIPDTCITKYHNKTIFLMQDAA